MSAASLSRSPSTVGWRGSSSRTPGQFRIAPCGSSCWSGSHVSARQQPPGLRRARSSTRDVGAVARSPRLRASRLPEASGYLDRVSAVSAEVEDVLESLREENEALAVRVAHLEATRDEYRRQMAGLLNSWS